MTSRKSVLIAVFILILAGTVSSAIPATERAALIKLYNEANGDNWEIWLLLGNSWKTEPLESDGFSPIGSEGDWCGITVSEDSVIKIELSNFDIAGIIPPELGNLSKLEVLDLSSNNFFGLIPAELGALSKLEVLDLHENRMQGSIPPQLGNLSSLKILNFDYNDMNCTIPPELGNLSSLQYLGLTSNRIFGTIPPELGNLSNLEHLSFAYNQLTGIIPPELGGISDLQYLYLTNNQLTGIIPPELGNLSSLQLLYLGQNQLTGSIPQELGNLSNMIYLNLDRNQISGGIPPELGNLSNMSQLSLDMNQLSGDIPTELRNLTNLIVGSIDYNALGSEDTDLVAFLNEKFGSWGMTQTRAPGEIVATPFGQGILNLSWAPIAYTENTGGYKVFIGTAPGGPYTLFDQTVNKSTVSMNITGLDEDRMYYFVIQTWTDSHGDQQNTIFSEYSQEVLGVLPSDHFVIAGTISAGGVPLKNVILYSDGGVPGVFSTDSAGNYQVVVPGNWTGTITPKQDGCIFSPPHMDYSSVLFNYFNQDYSATSSVPGSLTVISPNGGEEWNVGSVRAITWTGEGILGNVRIEFSTDNMATWADVAASTANDGSFEWTVPSTLSSQCRVRISDLSNAATADSSNSDFAIIAVSGSEFVNDGVWQNATAGLDGWYVGDFTGNGIDDIMNVTLRHQKVFESDGTGFTKLGSWTKALTGLYGWFPGDFNGDGKTDLLRYREVDRTQVFLSTGSAFVKDFIWASVNPGSDGYSIGDFNGDQVDDMLIFNGATNHSFVYLSTGTKFEAPVNWFKGHSGDDGWYTGDFNGDGLTDIARVNLTLGTQVLLSNGTAFVKNGVWTAALPPANGWFVADYNGDGKDDLMRCLDEQSGAEVFLSNGSAFTYDGCWSEASLLGVDWSQGDFTGDDRADLLRYNPANQESEVFISTAPSTPSGSARVDRHRFGDNLNKGIDLSRPVMTESEAAVLLRPWMENEEEGNYFLQIKKAVEEKLGRRVRDTVIHRMLGRYREGNRTQVTGGKETEIR